MQLENVTVKGEFEVFNSGGSWAFLLGKPMLRTFRAKQAYKPDTVSICDKNGNTVVLRNEIKESRLGGNKIGVSLTLDVKQWDIVTGGSSEMKPPPREVPHKTLKNDATTHTDIPAPPASV